MTYMLAGLAAQPGMQGRALGPVCALPGLSQCFMPCRFNLTLQQVGMTIQADMIWNIGVEAGGQQT